MWFEWLAKRRVRLGALVVVATVLLATPTVWSWGVGAMVAALGEALRVWAAGHLEKSREVTRSGPYRWMRHPLYVGSSLIALGVVCAARSVWVGLLAALYMGATIGAAVRTEEAHLDEAFGRTYGDYRAKRLEPMHRAFSVERVIRNREYRAVAGLVIGFGLLALWLRP